MAEPLLGHQPLVAYHLPGSGLVSVGSWPAGPAGSVWLDLGGGVELDMDAARPGCLVGVTIELPLDDPPASIADGLRRRLDLLLGPACGDDLVAFLREAGCDPVRSASAPLGTRDGGHPIAKRRADLPAPTASDLAWDVVPAIHRAAIAHGTACAPGARLLVRAVGLLEAAAELAAIDGVLDVADIVGRDLRIGVDGLLDAVNGSLGPVPGGKAARELAGLLRRVSRLTPGQSLVAARLATLARELERDGRRRPSVRRLATRLPPDHRRPAVPATDRPSPPRRVPVDVGSLTGALAEASLAASRTGPAEVELRIDGWAVRRGGLWARAFAAGDGSLLAVAPFRAGGGDAVARLLVPPDAIRRIEVDMTDRPEMPRLSPALAAMQRAIHLGRSAAQAERLGDVANTSLRWRQCARQWARAGDDERAKAALAFGNRGAESLLWADRPRSHEPVAPLVVDLIEAGG